MILVDGWCCQERAREDDLSILKVAGLSLVPDQESGTSSSGSVSGSPGVGGPVSPSPGPGKLS